MKNFFRNYFSFNQVELKGIRVLLIILGLLVVVYFLMPVFFHHNKKFDFAKYQAEVDTFMAHSKLDTAFEDNPLSDRRPKGSDYRDYEDNNYNKFQMKPFDPNGLPLEIWVQMGLSEKQAQVIKNFEAKGGKLKTKEDLKKQFVISAEFYSKIEPYIVFAEMNDEVISEHVPLSIDINHATKEDFMMLNGIKDYVAEGIVKYRDKLGGFTNVEQLSEVKEMKYVNKKISENLRTHFFITTYSIRKIQINLADWGEFAKHPYIGGEIATKIIDYRKKHGIFKSGEDFRKSGLVDEEGIAKLSPYLSFLH